MKSLKYAKGIFTSIVIIQCFTICNCANELVRRRYANKDLLSNVHHERNSSEDLKRQSVAHEWNREELDHEFFLSFLRQDLEMSVTPTASPSKL